jgi:Tol biopolymer transport system component
VSPGRRLGDYEVIAVIGRGGMGEVYRARDTRLGRDVALKTLPPAQQANREWRARFEREARALASLNHPNIAAIYGIEDAPTVENGPVTAIVMELVEGETLEERLRRGPLSLDEALNIAGQIAGALEAAHDKHVVHRDLKPANVQITPAGAVKLLDFGLAKFLPGAVDDEGTLTQVTGPAAVMGTPAYMAPEEVQGNPADRRVDVWAFGVMLYEMVTGEQLFKGQSVQDRLTAVLTSEPDWSRVPARVRPLLRACLTRDPRARLRDVGDYAFLLQAPPASAEGLRRSPMGSLALVAAALAAVGLAFFAGRWRIGPETAPLAMPLVRLSTMLPAGVSVTRGPGQTSSVAVSPDGRTIVIAGSDKDGQRLYRRSLDRLDPEPLPGTERGSSPFFSWDGKWIGFFADGRMKRMPADGGASIDVAAAPGFSSGASWGPDDRIVFAYGLQSPLYIVSAEGGTVEPLVADAIGRQPEVLPDGRTILFESAGYVYACALQTRSIKRLLPGTAPRFANGHVIFSRGTTLLAAPFNADTLSAGTPIPVAENVAVELPGSGGGRHYALSRDGSLVYVPAPDAYELVIVGADAGVRIVGTPQRSMENPRFSPDGRSLVVATRRRDGEPANLWLHDLKENTAASRLTDDGGRAAIWRDNSSVTYSHLGERQGVYVTRVAGGAPRQVLALEALHWLVGWSPDGSTLVYGQMMGNQRSSIMAYSNAQSRTVVGPGSTWGGRLSRDGRWLAYYVLDSGLFEVYVTPFPDGGGRWLIAEGTDPAWAPDGSEVYYRAGPRLMAARVDKTAGVRVTSTRVVIDPYLPPLYDDYDIRPDGRAVVAVRPANLTQGREVTIVLGWSDELRASDR